MAKPNIAEAYRLLPIIPSCYIKLGFRLMQNYYFDHCLPRDGGQFLLRKFLNTPPML